MAALAEIAGCFAVWAWWREENKEWVAASSALRSFILRECCELHEWQQCESCAAALRQSANGRFGP